MRDATTPAKAKKLFQDYPGDKVRCVTTSEKQIVSSPKEADEFFAYMAGPLPKTNEIKTFFHCGSCLHLKPPNQSAREWAMLEVGWTAFGFQVWCKRCEKNVIHADFGGQKIARAV